MVWREQDGNLFLVISRRSEKGEIGTNGDGAVYRSADGGESWIKMILPSGTNAPTSIITDPETPQRLLLSAWGRVSEENFLLTPAAVFFISEDDGKSWKQVMQKDQLCSRYYFR